MTADPCNDNYSTIIPIYSNSVQCTILYKSFIFFHYETQQRSADQQTFCGAPGPTPCATFGPGLPPVPPDVQLAESSDPEDWMVISMSFQCHLNVISAEFLRSVTLTLDEPTPEVVSETSLHLEHLSNSILRFQYLMRMQNDFLPTISNSIQF